MAYGSRIEDMVQGIATYLDAGIGTFLTGILAAKADGIPLDDFRVVKVGEQNVYTANPLPACFVYPEEVGIAPASLGADTIAIKLAFCVVFSGSNASNMLLQALRYAEALRQFFTTYPTCGGACDGMGPEMSIENVPAIGDGIYKKVVVLTATFLKDVNRS